VWDTYIDHYYPGGLLLSYQRARPGELVHMDTKKLGRIQTTASPDAVPAQSIGITGSSGSACTSASMTPAGSPTAKSYRTSAFVVGIEQYRQR
jgi:hypothetical protein